MNAVLRARPDAAIPVHDALALLAGATPRGSCWAISATPCGSRARAS